MDVPKDTPLVILVACAEELFKTGGQRLKDRGFSSSIEEFQTPGDGTGFLQSQVLRRGNVAVHLAHDIYTAAQVAATTKPQVVFLDRDLTRESWADSFKPSDLAQDILKRTPGTSIHCVGDQARELRNDVAAASGTQGAKVWVNTRPLVEGVLRMLPPTSGTKAAEAPVRRSLVREQAFVEATA